MSIGKNKWHKKRRRRLRRRRRRRLRRQLRRRRKGRRRRREKMDVVGDWYAISALRNDMKIIFNDGINNLINLERQNEMLNITNHRYKRTMIHATFWCRKKIALRVKAFCRIAENLNL